VACQHVALRATCQLVSFLPLGPCPAGALREGFRGQKLCQAPRSNEPRYTVLTLADKLAKPACWPTFGRPEKSCKLNLNFRLRT
jgi:hypothetical protein